MGGKPDNQWHLSKAVPVALVGASAIQSAAVIWWAATVDSRVTNIEKKISDYDELRQAVSRITGLQETILFEVREMRTDIGKIRDFRPGHGRGGGRGPGQGRHRNQGDG